MTKDETLPTLDPEEHTRHYDITVTDVNPITPIRLIEEFFQASADGGARAVIITGFATGTVPYKYFPSIRETIGKGIPVFVISNNSGEDKGPQRIKYVTQTELVGTGATVLTGANVNNAWEVADTIQDAIEQGGSGEALSQAVANVYGALTPNSK